MQKNESWFYQNRVKKCLLDLDPVRIEDKSGQGVPDVNCMIADIELKFGKPHSKDEDIFADGLLRKGQRAWLFRRWKAGGNAWCLIGYSTEQFILLNGFQASMLMGRTTWSIARQHLKPMDNLKNDLRSALFMRLNEMRTMVDSEAVLA